MVVRHVVGSGNQTQVFCRSTETYLLPSHPSSPSSLPGHVFQTRAHYVFKAVLKFLVRACCLFPHCGRILLHIIAVKCSKLFWDCSWSDEQQNNFPYSSEWNKGRWSSPCLEKSVDCHRRSVGRCMVHTKSYVVVLLIPTTLMQFHSCHVISPCSSLLRKWKHKMWCSRHRIVASVSLPSRK